MKFCPGAYEKAVGIEGFLHENFRVSGVVERSEDFIVEELLGEEIARAIPESTSPVRYDGVVRAVLVKKRLSTREAIRKIARTLGIHPGEIGYCGLKDSYGYSAQFVTLPGVAVREIKGGKEGPWLREFIPTSGKLGWGMHSGNHFTVRIKVNRAPDVEARAIEFPNFYGIQRFGTFRPVSHLVGKALLKGEWKKAGLTLLAMPSVLDIPAVKKAREEIREIERKGYRKYINVFPAGSVERYLLGKLSRGYSWKKAILSLDRNWLRLYIQSYSSYLFNRLLSYRLAIGSSRPLRDDYTSNGKIMLPVYGVGTRVKGRTGKELVRYLKENGIPRTAFERFPVKVRGSYREAFSMARDVGIREKDSRIEMEFILSPGSYATSFIREFIDICFVVR